MLAGTRSLMKRASRSSTNSSAHIISSSEANAIFELASCLPSGARALKTLDTECNSSSRINRINVGLSYGTPGTYHDADGFGHADRDLRGADGEHQRPPLLRQRQA